MATRIINDTGIRIRGREQPVLQDQVVRNDDSFATKVRNRIHR